MGIDGPMKSAAQREAEREEWRKIAIAEERRRDEERQRMREAAEKERRWRADRNRRAHDVFPQLLARYGTYLQTNHSPTLHSALFQWLEDTPANRPQTLLTWSEESHVAHHPRSITIEKAIHHLQQNKASKSRWPLCIDLLLGPRLHEAKAKAAFAFFNPEQHFYHTVLEMVVKLIQEKVAQNKQKNAADFYEDLTVCFQFYPLLEKAIAELAQSYQKAFPFLAEKFNTPMKDWLSYGEWQCSLMELLDNVNQRLFFPGIRLENYTLEQFEQQAFFVERKRYEKALAQYLKRYPQDSALFLEAAQLSQDLNVRSNDEERQEELIQHFSFLPAQMPWAFSDYYLNQGHIPSVKLLDIFLAHGADLAHLPVVYSLFTPEAWSILDNALKYQRPQSPLDTFICTKLQTYCQKPHNKARWLSIVEAVSDRKTTPLAKRLLETCQTHEKYRGRSSQLLKAAKEAQAYLQKPRLKLILLSFYACFEKSEPWIGSTTVCIDATTPWETFLKLPEEATTLVVEDSWFRRNHPDTALQRLSAYFPRFKHLSFSNTGLTDDALYALMNVWGYIENPRKTIEILDLSHNLITDEGLQKIASRLPSWPKLKILNLSGNLMTAEGVEALLAVLPQTKIISIQLGRTFVLEEALTARISHGLILNTHISNVLLLNAKKSHLKRDSNTPMLETSDKTSLSASTLSEHSLSEEDISASMEAENKEDEALAYMSTLPGFLPDSTHLNLSLDTVGEIDLNHLLVYLQHRQTPLVSIHFDGQSVKNLKDEDFLLWIDALNRFPTLKTLSFQNTDIHVYGEEGYSSKVTLLKQYLCCPHLKTLDLCGNDFSATDIDELTAFSQVQGSLEAIYINSHLRQYALQTQLSDNCARNQGLEDITYQLYEETSQLLVPLPLIPPTLRTLRYTPAAPTTKTWYHLLPVKGNTFLFDFSSKAFLRAEQQRHYFFKADADVGPLVPKSDKRYHDHLCGMLYLVFTLAKEAKEDWSLGGVWSFPFEKIAGILSRLGSQTNTVGFILYVADFLYQHYLYTGKAHQLDEDKAFNDALSVIQWMHDNDTPENPVVQLLMHQKLQVRHLSLLLPSCMGETPIVMAVPTAQLSQYHAMIADALPPEAVFHNSHLPLLTLATPKPLSEIVSFENNTLPEWDITFPEDIPEEETCKATWVPVLQQLYQGRYSETSLTLRELVPTGKLTLTHIEHLAKAIPEGGKITKLNANGMQFTPETWQAFCEFISRWSHLKELHVENALYEGALHVLAPALEGLSRLTTLNISNNAGKTTVEDMAIFLPKLPHCEELHSLHMSCNGLTDEMLDLLWRNLPCLKKLEKVYLSNNHLTPHTIKQFEQQKSKVTSLNLDHNNIELTEINLLSEELDKRKLEQWDRRLREMVRKDADDYANRNSKTNFLVRQFYHGSSTSMTHAQTFAQYEEQKDKSDRKTLYLLRYLKKYLLDESISSMGDGGLDTPIVTHMKDFFEQTEHPKLRALHEQLQQLSIEDTIVRERARKNTPFYVNAFPQLFAEQYQRCLERARLGLSIDNRLKGMDEKFKETLQSLPRNPDELSKQKEIENVKREINEVRALGNSHTRVLSHLTSRVQTLEEDVAILKEKYNLLDSAVHAIQQIEREAFDPVPVSSTTYEGLQILITNLQREQGMLVDTLTTLMQQGKTELAEKLHTLQEKVIQHSDILDHLRPSKRVELSAEKAAYVTHFQQTVFQLYLASLMISTGLFSYHSDGTLSKASNVFKSLGNIIPFAGSGMKLLSSLLKTADKVLLERRMNRLCAMGGFFEVMALAETLAMKLFDINLPSPLNEDLLDKMLSAAENVTTAEEATSFIQGVWKVAQESAGDFISHLLAKPSLTAIEERAEQDANLFLTRLCQEGMPHRHALYLSATAEILPRPETLVIYWIDANTLGCHLPDGRHIPTLNEVELGRYYASLSHKAQRESQLITLAEEQVVNEIVAQEQWLPKVSRFTTLLFYAIPLFVVADEIFKETLLLFCRIEGLHVDLVTNKNNPYHRKEWCQNLTYAMNCYTNQIQEPISEPGKRQAFVKAVAKEYQEVESSTPSASALICQGLFYLKPKNNKPNASEKYVSMHLDRCTPEVAEDILKKVTLNRR